MIYRPTQVTHMFQQICDLQETDVGIYEERIWYADNGNSEHLKRWSDLTTLIVETTVHMATFMQDNRWEGSLHGGVWLLNGEPPTKCIIDEAESHEKVTGIAAALTYLMYNMTRSFPEPNLSTAVKPTIYFQHFTFYALYFQSP